MKSASIFLLIFCLISCTSTKKTAAIKKSTPVHKITRTDVFKGGTSFDNAIVIKVQTESDGVAEEYRWLNESYPGYSTVRKTQTTREKRHFDIITFKTKNGVEKNAYFDITSFYHN